MIGWIELTTVVLFISFISLCAVLYLPSRSKAYKDADKLALKDEGEIITPRHIKIDHEETKP